MDMQRAVTWVLRLAVAGEFAGHGVFALRGQAQWVSWIEQLTRLEANAAATLLAGIGLLDLAVALLTLLWPLRAVLLWATFWGFWTTFVVLLVGEPLAEFIAEWPNWGAPLALLLLRGWPRSVSDWFA